MKKLVIFLVILTMNSCDNSKENGIEMEIKNESSKPITNIKFTTTENLDVLKIDRIEPGKSVTDFLSMMKNKADGAYTLNFIRADGTKEISNAGYYTNGKSLNYWVGIVVKKDTTLIKFGEPNFK